MLITSAITALMAAPSLTISAFVMVQDQQELARIFYHNCLVDAHNDAMESNVSLKQFEVITKEACTEERKIYYDFIFKDEKQFGASAKEAEKYATEESDNIRQFIISSYATNFNDKLLLVKS